MPDQHCASVEEDLQRRDEIGAQHDEERREAEHGEEEREHAVDRVAVRDDREGGEQHDSAEDIKKDRFCHVSEGKCGPVRRVCEKNHTVAIIDMRPRTVHLLI